MPPPTIAIDGLGLDRGGQLLVALALEGVAVGDELIVTGDAPAWDVHLATWCRQQGHAVRFATAEGRLRAHLVRGADAAERWQGALATGHADASVAGAVADEADPAWGLAARGARVEAGGPAFPFALRRKRELWAETAGELYRQALAAQWDPATAIDWTAPRAHDEAMERAVVQVMTYLVENENAALLVPARHLGAIHPHYREVLQLLAVQCADEARHVEVFARRAALHGHAPGLSSAGGQASLRSLFAAPDFSSATFLLAVFGEGAFVTLLTFLHDHAPDPVTRQIGRLTARDEARHVAFGMAHLEQRLEAEPGYRDRLRQAVEQRHDLLASSAGLNHEVFAALVRIAGGGVSPAAVARGHALVQDMVREMAAGRRTRLVRLGFPPAEAERLAELHTRNFM